MIRISQLRIRIHRTDAYDVIPYDALRRKAAKEMRCETYDIRHITIRRRSIDARRKPEIFDTYTITVEADGEDKILRRCHNNRNITRENEKRYSIPLFHGIPKQRPVVTGSGPAGMFCAYALALAGMRPLVLERGDPVDKRTEAVRAFWNGGRLDAESNVQFGEGGAGTFSDGKLNTMVRDRDGRNAFVLHTFVECGAPEEILWDARPHLGTDMLSSVMRALRDRIQELGGTFLFRTRLEGIHERDGALYAIDIIDPQGNLSQMPCDRLVLATGHSARDTFQMLYGSHIRMRQKPFAVGLRIEHPQEMIDCDMYGSGWDLLPPSSYKLAHTFPDHRGVYSFCMCPGGYVVNASSERGRLAVNGMSYADRASGNANSALVITTSAMDFDTTDPLAGIAFQRTLEKRAYAAANGAIPQQLYQDFLADIPSRGYGDFESATCGRRSFANLRGVLPEAMERALICAMESFGQKIRGFDRPDAILSGFESRTSSPVRIERDATYQSSLRGVYPCGEGAGYAGGIMSAAMDGLKVAEAIIMEK